RQSGCDPSRCAVSADGDSMKSKVLTFFTLTVILGVVSSCQRSPQFKEEQSFYRPDPPSYYNRSIASKSPTQRAEMIGQPKKRIMVLNFWNDTPVKQIELG